MGMGMGWGEVDKEGTAGTEAAAEIRNFPREEGAIDAERAMGPLDPGIMIFHRVM
jgi:hypothetical protein